MTELNELPNDPLDSVLVASDQRDADDDLREAVFTQTVGVMRRRRRLRRFALAASLLCCYLAGVATVGVWRHDGEASTQVAAETTTAQPRLRKAPPRTLPRPMLSQSAQVATAQPSGFESRRPICDHYLRDSNDIPFAIADDAHAWDIASEKQLMAQVSRLHLPHTTSWAADTGAPQILPNSVENHHWLSTALKDARAKEKIHSFSEQN